MHYENLLKQLTPVLSKTSKDLLEPLLLYSRISRVDSGICCEIEGLDNENESLIFLDPREINKSTPEPFRNFFSLCSGIEMGTQGDTDQLILHDGFSGTLQTEGIDAWSENFPFPFSEDLCAPIDKGLSDYYVFHPGNGKLCRQTEGTLRYIRECNDPVEIYLREVHYRLRIELREGSDLYKIVSSMPHPHEWVEEEWLHDPEGYKEHIEWKKQEASYNTLSKQLQDAVNSGDFSGAAEIGDSLLQLPHVTPGEIDANDCQLISMSYTSTGRHDKSIELVENWKPLKENKRMMSWFITIMIHASSFEKAIETWKRHKPFLTHEEFDPFMITNLLCAYDRLGRYEEAINELEDYFTKKGAGGDKGLMKFNAACLYSLCGRIDHSLKMAALSLEEGKDRESFYSDPGLENFRKEPAFALLMSEEPVTALAFLQKGTARYAELVLNRKRQEVITRESSHKENPVSCRESVEEHKNRADTILAYLHKKKDYLDAGYEETPPLCIEYWVKQFTLDLRIVKERQEKGELPAFGCYYIEWNPGESDCQRNIWIGYYNHAAIGEIDLSAGKHFSLDNELGEGTDGGPPIDTSGQFETIVKELIQTKEYQAIQKESPFYFVYQEHDGPHISTVKI